IQASEPRHWRDYFLYPPMQHFVCTGGQSAIGHRLFNPEVIHFTSGFFYASAPTTYPILNPITPSLKIS
ncbi:hypothetical protein ACA086_03515, partial [Muriicola sp. E247]|uniref:hypothetical protein n=1 Tax=Muriicola sp. E247 TaxID=3242730 RepID=UPI003524DA2A